MCFIAWDPSGIQVIKTVMSWRLSDRMPQASVVFPMFSKDVVIRFLDFWQVVSSHDHGNCKSLIARMVHSRAIIVIVLTSPPGLVSGKIYRKYRETKPSIFVVKTAFIFTHACARMHTHAHHAHHAHHQSIHPPICLSIHQSIHPSTYVSHPICSTSHKSNLLYPTLLQSNQIQSNLI